MSVCAVLEAALEPNVECETLVSVNPFPEMAMAPPFAPALHNVASPSVSVLSVHAICLSYHMKDSYLQTSLTGRMITDPQYLRS